MKIFDVCNPVIVAEVLSRDWISSDDAHARSAEFRTALARVETIFRTDDSVLCKVLDKDQLSEYSVLVSTLMSVHTRAKDMVARFGLESKVLIPEMANLIAWQRVFCTFQTLNAPAESEK